MAGAPFPVAETGDGAVDDSLRNVRGPDAEPCRHPGPEGLQHDVGASAQRRTEARVARAVPQHGFLAGVEGSVPGRRDITQEIAVRCLEPNDARTKPKQLPARERSRQIPREVDDELACKRLHYAHKVD